MNATNGVRMTYGNIISTLAIAAMGLWGFADISQATEANASEIKHEKELREQQEKFLNEKLERIEQLLEKLAQERV